MCRDWDCDKESRSSHYRNGTGHLDRKANDGVKYKKVAGQEEFDNF